MRKIVCFSLLILAVGCLACCRPPAQSHSKELPRIPRSYAADSIQSAPLKPWREFFNDSLLINLVENAIANNPDLLIAIQRVEMARADQRVAKASLLPTLSAGGFAGQRKFGKYTMDGVGNFDTNFSSNITDDMRVPDPYPDYYLGLQSNWEIDVWGRLKNQRRATVARFQATEKGQQLVTTVLVSAVARLYYELLTLDNQLIIIRENITVQQRALDVVTLHKEAGRVNSLAVKQMEAQLLSTKSLEGGTRQSILETENQINLLLGRFPQPVRRSSPILQQGMPAQLDAGIPSQMLARRPDIRQAEYELVAARADVSAARAAYYPALTLSSGVGFQSFTPTELFNPASVTYSVFGGLTGPIFNRFAVSSGHRRATAAQEQAIQNYHKTVLTAFQEVLTHLGMISNMAEVSGYKEAQVKALVESELVSIDLYNAGKASYLEVFLAQRSVLIAELELAETRNKQFGAVIDLYRALGGGWD